jgi:hypothetical protein
MTKSEYNRQYRLLNPERCREGCRRYYKKHRERILQQKREYSDDRKVALRQRARGYYITHREARSTYARTYNQKIKRTAFLHYGDGKIQCALCGETDWIVLTIDHINGNGGIQRKSIGSGSRFYQWLIQHQFPPGFRVLCMNCQFRERHRLYYEKTYNI